MIVYAVHTGSIYEGGALDRIYANKEKAIEYCETLFRQKDDHDRKIHDEDPDRWGWARESETRWKNIIEEIIILECEVIE